MFIVFIAALVFAVSILGIGLYWAYVSGKETIPKPLHMSKVKYPEDKDVGIEQFTAGKMGTRYRYVTKCSRFVSGAKVKALKDELFKARSAKYQETLRQYEAEEVARTKTRVDFIKKSTYTLATAAFAIPSILINFLK